SATVSGAWYSNGAGFNEPSPALGACAPGRSGPGSLRRRIPAPHPLASGPALGACAPGRSGPGSLRRRIPAPHPLASGPALGACAPGRCCEPDATSAASELAPAPLHDRLAAAADLFVVDAGGQPVAVDPVLDLPARVVDRRRDLGVGLHHAADAGRVVAHH